LQDAGQLTLEVIIWIAVVDSLILCPWVDDAHRCRDTVIGGPFLRGISGGERKRVSIGHEILTDPSLLFLDEPTSGLDSTTALRIIQVVKNIAQVHITLQALKHTGVPYPNCCIAMAASIDVTFSIFYFIKSSVTLVCTNHRIVHGMTLMVKPPKILKQIGLKHVHDTYQ
jgi:hypothetical protein